MAELGQPKIIELFHIAFLDALSRKIDPSRYVLKGGANLRYFFRSLRYSEDIDIDADGLQTWRLEEQVDGILAGTQLPLILRQSGLRVGDYSKPKQTDTTQRWKVAIVAPGESPHVRTKIEFSKREISGSYELDPIPAAVVRSHGLRAPTVQHYVGDAPVEQKIEALALRTQVQARDIFDLDLLFRLKDVSRRSIDIGSDIVDQAIEQAMGVTYAEYRDQVLPFLEPEAVELYQGEASWEQLQLGVIEQLESAR